jgi:hypothetical protein
MLATESLENANKDMKREEEDMKKERKVIKMVILNGIFNFFLRAPDVLFWIENENVWFVLFRDQVAIQSNAYVSVTPGLFGLIADVGYFTYILTFTTNFVIFFKFNANFKEAVGLLLISTSRRKL